MDKKNTLLLTVIAIATLLVAVVGATFAYFSAQVGKEASTTMNVTTSSEDTLTYNGFEPIYIIANQTNFAQVGELTGQLTEKKIGSQKGIAKATVELRAGTTNEGTGSTTPYCYNATIDITTNGFKYAEYSEDFFRDIVDDDKPTSGETKAPELLLKITKNKQPYSETIYYIDTAKKTDLEGEGTTKSEVKYTANLKKNRRVCTQTGVTASSGIAENDEKMTCQDNQQVGGYDITEIPINKSILIPAENKAGSNESTKTAIKHEIKGTGVVNQKVTDVWEAELVFVNYEWDQQYNVGKLFSATWNFTSVDCSTGDVKN